MWKPRLESNTPGPGNSRVSIGAMAHRRTMGGRKLLAGSLALVLLAVMLAGSVYVSNRVTGLRAEIARLECRREFLEAGSARLLTAWNKATAPAMIISRARKELVLVKPEEPDLVLVQMPATGEAVSAWRRLWGNMGGPEAAQAAPVPADAPDGMVSLSPQPADAGGDS